VKNSYLRELSNLEAGIYTEKAVIFTSENVALTIKFYLDMFSAVKESMYIFV